MRHLFAALIALVTLTDVVFAGEAEGAIKAIDRDGMVITLENGKAYKLPGEFDIDKIKEGMDVIIAFDEINGENLITDMETSEQ
ncbi:MAG: DUF1344 domain-containing protein [Phyllobacteriaceae bacterium]|nr:DUF1344 domain-containing protein [Phyllobacteriaceae bacterium]